MESRDRSQRREADSDPMRELRNLAYMYYAMGNYAKAEEILSLIRDIEERQSKQLGAKAA